MISRYRGRVGEYLWEKEMQRLERYKDRPWELESKYQPGADLFALALVCIGGFGLLALLSLF